MSLPEKAGTLAKCLEHFVATRQLNVPATAVDQGVIRVRNEICRLLGISQSAGYDWFTGQHSPIGVNRIKLCLFLEMSGYRVQERIDISDDQRLLADCIALEVITLSDIIKQTLATNDTAMRWISGKRGIPSKANQSIKDLFDTHQTVILEKRKQWETKIEELGLSGQSPKVAVSVVPPSVVLDQKSAIPGLSHEQVIAKAAGLIAELLPLLNAVDSDGYTAEERKKLRQSTKSGVSNGVFELSNVTSRLCSETSRKNTNGQG